MLYNKVSISFLETLHEKFGTVFLINDRVVVDGYMESSDADDFQEASKCMK